MSRTSSLLQSASGKSVTISDESKSKVKGLLGNDNSINNSSIKQLHKQNVPSLGPKSCFIRDKSNNDVENPSVNVNIGTNAQFKTNVRKPLGIKSLIELDSTESTTNDSNQLNNSCISTDNYALLSKATPYSLYDCQGSNCNSESKAQRPTPQPRVSLLSASGKTISISDEAKRKAMKLFESSTSTVAFSNDSSYLDVYPVVSSKEIGNLPTSGGIKTLKDTTGYPYAAHHLSSHSLDGIKSSSTSESDVSSKRIKLDSIGVLSERNETGNISQTESNASLADNMKVNINNENQHTSLKNPTPRLSMLQSARGKVISISSDAVAKAKMLLENNSSSCKDKISHRINSCTNSSSEESEKSDPQNLFVYPSNSDSDNAYRKSSQNENHGIVPASNSSSISNGQNSKDLKNSSLDVATLDCSPFSETISRNTMLYSNPSIESDPDLQRFDPIYLTSDYLRQIENITFSLYLNKIKSSLRFKRLTDVNSRNALSLSLSDFDLSDTIPGNPSCKINIILVDDMHINQLLLRSVIEHIWGISVPSQLQSWLVMQLRWIMWTLAAYERKFPNLFYGKFLRLDSIFECTAARFRMYSGQGNDEKTCEDLFYHPKIMNNEQTIDGNSRISWNYDCRQNTLNTVHRTHMINEQKVSGWEHFKRKGAMSPLQRSSETITFYGPMVLIFSVYLLLDRKHHLNSSRANRNNEVDSNDAQFVCQVTDGWWWTNVKIDVGITELIKKV